MATVRVGGGGRRGRRRRRWLAREGGGVRKEAGEERHVNEILHAAQVEEAERAEGRRAPVSGTRYST